MDKPFILPVEDKKHWARRDVSKGRAMRYNALQLAYMGDTVYDLFVRAHLMQHSDAKVHALSRKATELVCAHGQSQALMGIESHLTPEEEDIVRRGRNAHSRSVPRHADPAEYARATALEALIGYLFLTGQDERIEFLLSLILEGDSPASGQEANILEETE